MTAANIPIPIRTRCSGLCTVHCPDEDPPGEGAGDMRGNLAEYEQEHHGGETLTGDQVTERLTALGCPPPAIRMALTHAAHTRPEDGPVFLAAHSVITDGDGFRILEHPAVAPGTIPAHIHEDDGTVEGCPGCFWDADLAWVRGVIELVDRHLDEAAPAIYRDNPLANRWRRIAGGPFSEGREAVDALCLSTGGNPRKGVVGDRGTVLSELGDDAVASLLAIQSETKNITATWEVFLAALAKARSRVPDRNPS